jgi:hypothetical protein
MVTVMHNAAVIMIHSTINALKGGVEPNVIQIMNVMITTRSQQTDVIWIVVHASTCNYLDAATCCRIQERNVNLLTQIIATSVRSNLRPV